MINDVIQPTINELKEITALEYSIKNKTELKQLLNLSVYSSKFKNV